MKPEGFFLIRKPNLRIHDGAVPINEYKLPLAQSREHYKPWFPQPTPEGQLAAFSPAIQAPFQRELPSEPLH